MKTLLLVLSLVAVAYCQTGNPTCVGLRLQNETECANDLQNLVSLDVTTFCAGECAVTLRQIFMDCGYGSQNLIQDFCNGAVIAPSTSCIATALPQLTPCLTVLSGDPTAFCTSQCFMSVSTVFDTCGFTGPNNPATVLCSANLTTTNFVCVAARMGSLSNCAIELLASPVSFCTSACAMSVRDAYDECGFSGPNNLVTQVCSSQIPIQDPLCAANRLQNLQSCTTTFLTNVSAFCDSPCSDAFRMAYSQCGYSGDSNPVAAACANRPVVGGDPLCLSSRLSQLTNCIRQINEDPSSFCNSECRTQINDAYVNCGYPNDGNLTAGICQALAPGGPDSICLSDRLAGAQSCVTLFLTQPTQFCSSSCFFEVRDAYEQCNYTAASGLNPLAFGCQPITEDPLCLVRQLFSLGDCVDTIFFNQTSFCTSNCRNRVSSAFSGCGYSMSDPSVLCLSPDPSVSIQQCLSTQLAGLQGCYAELGRGDLAGFCTGSCATDIRNIYIGCGAINQTNPVDLFCAGSGSQDAALCLSYGLINQTGCLAVLLSNATSFCTSSCYTQVSTIYNNCGFTGPANTVEVACAAPTQGPDPVCLSTGLQSQLSCLVQLLTDRGTFCSSECATSLSGVYTRCGYTGSYNDVERSCSSMPTPSGPSACVSESTVYHDCIAELSLNPNGFCTSTCRGQIDQLFLSCNIPAAANPVTAFCAGLVPNVPGQPSPTCLANGLTDLQACLGAVTTNPTSFCTLPCAADVSAAYDECGFPNYTNPITLLCPTSSGPADLTCLQNSLTNVQGCLVELTMNPTSFCGSRCASDLSNAYAMCGLDAAANPVTIACGGGAPNQDPFCVSGKLTGLDDCTSKIQDQDFCGSECESDLRTAYSECGFTGTTNPVAALCNTNDGSPNSVCLGQQLQLHQECVAELFMNPESACDSTSQCATTVNMAYTQCRYVGSDNPIGSRCSQTGNGAVANQVLPFALTLLLLMALAAIFY